MFADLAFSSQQPEVRRLSTADINGQPPRTWYDPCKVVFDTLVAAVLLVLALPILLVAGLLVKLSSRGPVFAAQTRLGRFGRPYRLWRIRTTYHHCDRLCVTTPVGRLLRRLHIEELPQLWNVLKGDMSLVGPCPERLEFVPQLAAVIPGYRDRLLVRPGLTGLAQVQLPPDTDLASVRRKLACDLYYLRRRGPLLDLQILLAALGHLFCVPFSLVSKVLRVPRRAVFDGTSRI